MAEFIRYLKDADGNIFYPITHVDAVKSNSGTNLYQTVVDNNLQTKD